MNEPPPEVETRILSAILSKMTGEQAWAYLYGKEECRIPEGS